MKRALPTTFLLGNKKIIVEIISALFILLFVYTAVSKLSEFEGFKYVLKDSPLIGTYNEIVAWTLPVSELIIATLLFFPKTRLIGLYSSLVIMTVFTLYLAYMIMFTPDKPCNCGGVLKQMSWNQHLVFNIFFTSLAGLGIWLQKKKDNINNPEKQQIYGAVLSLYISRLIRIVNKKDKLPCSLIFEELPTIFVNQLDSLIATARSNRIATFLVTQDFSQVRKDYGKDQADVIVNIAGNIISGQVMGDTAKMLSERFGKNVQDRQSLTINRMDTSINKSTQLDFAIPQSKISALSSGEFVGMVADDPHEKIKLKMFHCEIQNDTEKLKAEAANLKPIPKVSNVSPQQVMDNYFQVKLDIKMLIKQEMARIDMEREAYDEDEI